jgi:predicted acetyltransferase
VTLQAIAQERAAVLVNLFELYVHDFSEHMRIPLKPSGRFELLLDDAWWKSPDHFPFLLLHDGELCGFALVRRGSRVTADADVMDVAEFFVARGWRQQRVGMAAAHALFARFAGRWEIRVRESNVGAQRFWLRSAQVWLGREVGLTPFEAQGTNWRVLRLDSAAGRAS